MRPDSHRTKVRKVFPNSYCGLSAIWGWTIWSDASPHQYERLSHTSKARNENEAWISAARNLDKHRRAK